MRTMNVLTLASLNRGKQEEFRTVLGQHNLKMATLDEFVRNAGFLSQVESQAEGATYEENAKRKCHAAFMAAKVPTFADDSGLELECLQWKPGVHSAHFGKPSAHESQDAANRRKVFETIGKGSRKARMRCVIVFMVEGVHITVEGICEGRIAEKEVGTAGFGYDSIFIPDAGNGKTFAELNREEKNRISHRTLAVAELVKQLRYHEIELVRP